MDILSTVENNLKAKGFEFERKDLNRPWGGFWVISGRQKRQFIKEYFPELDTQMDDTPISPKILMVAPDKKLSWQYHNRRSEVWRIVEGIVGVVRSRTDKEGRQEQYYPGDRVQLSQGERHRLVGKDDWGMVAEIWVHTDQTNLSDEDDIVRLQDDFGR